MNLQELLQGVLSLGPGNRPSWQTSYLDPRQQPAPQGALAAPQQAPAPPQQQAPLPLGPYAVHPGLQQALQPGQTVAQPGAGDALRDFQNGVLSPQPDPNQPQASPQPGNGVLAQNNTTAMAQAVPNQPQAPGGLPARGEDVYPPGGLSGPEANPKTWLPPESSLGSADMYRRAAEQQANGGYQQGPLAKPSAAKADPHTRAKGILAAAVSGDPQAIQQAVMDPQAASQAGSQVPDGPNWNPGSAYDTADAPLPPKNAADAQKQADAAHAQDKQQTFGQKALGVLSNPDTGLLLQSIGVGLLTSRNPWQGIGQGVQMYQQLHLKNQDRQLEAQRVAVEERRATSQEKYQDASLAQGDKRITIDQGDQELRRDQYAQVAKQQALQFGLEQSRATEQARHDRADEGNTAASTRATIARLNMEMGQPLSTQILPTPDGQGSKVVRTYRDNRIEVSDLPGVSAGVSLAALQGKQDGAAEGGMAAKANNALHELDDVNRTDQILAANPHGVGPSAASGTYRWVAQTLGLPGNDPVTELQNLKANQQLDLAVAKLKGQGQVSDKERALIGQAAQNVQTMSPALLKQLNDVRRKQALNDMGVYDAYLEQNPTRATGALAFDYKSRRKQMTDQGGPRSGADTSGNTPGDLSADDLALITKHLK